MIIVVSWFNFYALAHTIETPSLWFGHHIHFQVKRKITNRLSETLKAKNCHFHRNQLWEHEFLKEQHRAQQVALYKLQVAPNWNKI